MKLFWRLVSALLATASFFVVATLSGCATVPAQRGDVIGVLRVSGPNVMLDNRAGRDGDKVRVGSSLTTGPDSSALVDLEGGGVVQLDENTDPFFDYIRKTKCILVQMLKGQVYLDKGHACVKGPSLAMVLESEVNIRIFGIAAEVTLLKGRVDLEQPQFLRVEPGQQVSTAGERIVSVRTLSAAELRKVVAWRKGYRFSPLPRSVPFSTVPPGPPVPDMTAPSRQRPKQFR